MNKRIIELAQEAGMYVDLNGNPWPKWMSAEECEVAYEKFADLIIRDCAKQVNHIYKQGGGTWGEIILTRFEIKI
jgi:hypothetical protein